MPPTWPGDAGAPPFHPVATEEAPAARAGQPFGAAEGTRAPFDTPTMNLVHGLVHLDGTNSWRSWHAQKPATRLTDTQPTLWHTECTRRLQSDNTLRFNLASYPFENHHFFLSPLPMAQRIFKGMQDAIASFQELRGIDARLAS